MGITEAQKIVEIINFMIRIQAQNGGYLIDLDTVVSIQGHYNFVRIQYNTGHSDELCFADSNEACQQFNQLNDMLSNARKPKNMFIRMNKLVVPIHNILSISITNKHIKCSYIKHDERYIYEYRPENEEHELDRILQQLNNLL